MTVSADQVRGRFISFEGGEGTGKSTQARRLADRLREQGVDVLVTREPGGTEGAEIIRRTVLSGRVESMGPFAESVLMNAGRDDHLVEVIRPALASGQWVVCDRFADSTRAYQGILGGLDDTLLDAMETVILGQTRPDLTLILDIDPEIGLARARATTQAEHQDGSDRFERASMDDHRRLRQAFLDIAERFPARCVVIDADGSEDGVAEAVWACVSQRLLSQAEATGDTPA